MHMFILFTVIYYFMNFSLLDSSNFDALEGSFLEKRLQIYLLHHNNTAYLYVEKAA